MYQSISDTSIKCCSLKFLYGYDVFKGLWRAQNKMFPYDLGKICYWKSILEIYAMFHWRKGLLCRSSVWGAILTWTWQQPEGLWRGKGVAPGFADSSSAARDRPGWTFGCGIWKTAQGAMPLGWWGTSNLPCKRASNKQNKGKQISYLPVSEDQAVTSHTGCQKVIYLTTFQWQVRDTYRITQQPDSDTKSVRECLHWTFTAQAVKAVTFIWAAFSKGQ